MRTRKSTSVTRLTRHTDKLYVEDGGANAMTWMESAACAGSIAAGVVEDISIFPIQGATTATREFTARWCGSCPVTSQCLRYALAHGYTGVWGGRVLTDADVAKYRRQALAAGVNLSAEAVA